MDISTLQRDPSAQQFFVTVDEERAFIDYVREGSVYRLNHCEVPTRLRGQGVAKVLVEETFQAITDEGCTAEAICTYVKLVAKRSTRWREVVKH